VNPIQFADVVDVTSAVEPDAPLAEQMTVEAQSAGAIRSGKLAGKSMWSAIWILALPVLVEQLMNACVGLVDKVLAGSLPSQIVVPAMDAIGIGSYVGWLIGIAMTGLGIGGQVLIARGMGAGDLNQSGRALGQALGLSMAWGAVVGAVMWIAAVPLAHLCQLSDEATFYCKQYVDMIALAMPFTGVMMVGAMCMHGGGETTLPSLIAVGVNVVNIVVSWILSGVDVQIGGSTLINPFSYDLNVLGIAGGTAIAYFFGAICTIAVLVRGVKDLRLQTAHMRPDRSMTRRIVSLGIPNFFEGLAMWGVNLLVLIFIGQIARAAGSDGAEEGLQGAHIIAVQWESLSFLPGFAMGTAAGALAGQFLGAGNPRMAQKSIMACAGVACAIMGALGIVFMTQGAFLTSIISSQPVHLKHTPHLLFIAGTIQVFFAIAMVVRQGLRGSGDAIGPFVITTTSSYLVRLPLAWLLGVVLGYGIEGIWMGLCAELVVRSLLFTGRFLHGGWKRLKV
jgi:putative MATE family efflux protein